MPVCMEKNHKNDVIIRSVSSSQDEILKWILKLYVPAGRFEVDPTYSVGGFYKNIPPPGKCFDLHPVCPGVRKADCRHLPLDNASITSMILDPPFLATTGKSLQEDGGNIMGKRYSLCSSEAELKCLYHDAIKEAARVLKPGGILVFKCQDKVSSGKQHWTHCYVYETAVNSGFEPTDLFIRIVNSRLIADWQRNQKHARKFHSYFWVFKKRGNTVKKNKR